VGSITHRSIGLMSGSSLDGIDVVSCSFNYKNEHLESWSLDSADFYSLNPDLIAKIKMYKSLSPIELKKLDLDLAAFFAQSINTHRENTDYSYDVVGIHGQTIFHLPKEQLTCQLGNGSKIQSLIRLPVVADFRIKDILAGGEGTPMAPLADDYLFSGYDFYLNLGGIANISYKNSAGDWLAYDVCPFNQLSNYYANKIGLAYDENGLLGSKGSMQNEILKQLESYAYFRKLPPKSLDNNWIMEQFIPKLESLDPSPEDALASFYTFAAQCITEAVLNSGKLNSGKMFITGGGSYNVFFIETLKEKLAKHKLTVVLPEKQIIDNKEAMLIALAASFKLLGKPNFYSSVTGASTSVCGGVLFN